MNKRQWQLVERLFVELAGVLPAEREVHLDATCPSDDRVRAEVSRLLELGEEPEDFLVPFGYCTQREQPSGESESLSPQVAADLRHRSSKRSDWQQEWRARFNGQRTFLPRWLIAWPAVLSLVAALALVVETQIDETVAPSSIPSAYAGPSTANDLCEGTFGVYVSGKTHPVGLIWVEAQPHGEVTETWLLLRPNASDGWVFPSSTNTSVDRTIDYAGAVQHGSLADFKTWAASQYDVALGVDKDVDFETHTHTVEID